MNRNLNRRIHPIAEADWLSPKKLVIFVTDRNTWTAATVRIIRKL